MVRQRCSSVSPRQFRVIGTCTEESGSVKAGFVSATLVFHRADIPRLCKVFNLDYRECKKVFTPDSRGHVALPDLVQLAIRDNYPKSSSPYWGTPRTAAYHHSSSSRGNIPHSLLHAPAIAFDTEGSFSPPPERYTPDEGPYLTRPPSRSAPDHRVSCILTQKRFPRSYMFKRAC